LRPVEDPDSKGLTLTFQAQEGKGQALADQLQTILDGAKEGCDEKHGCPKEMLEQVHINSDEETGKVSIKLDASMPDMGEEDEKELEEGLKEKPTLEFNVHTGRTFDEMVNVGYRCPWTLEGGVNITANTKLANALMSVLADESAVMDGPMKGVIDAFQSFSFVSDHTEIRYNTEKFEAAVADFENGICTGGEETDEEKEMINHMKAGLPHMLVPYIGEDAVRAAGDLKDNADHLDSILFSVDPEYEIYMEFENFHLTPVISEFMQLPEAEEA